MLPWAHSLTSSTTFLSNVPCVSHISIGESAFFYLCFLCIWFFYEPKVWKSLPLDIRMASSVYILGRKLRTYSFNLAFDLKYCNGLSCFIFFLLLFWFFWLTFIFYSLIFNLFVVLFVVIFLVLHSVVHCCLILVCVVSTLWSTFGSLIVWKVL